jgi:putative transposase
MPITKTVIKRTNLRVYPTKAQETVLAQSFGNSRFIWNYYTSIFNNKEITNKIYPTIKELKEKYNFDFLKLSPSCCQQQTIRHFQETIKQFFNKNRKSKINPPKFKKKGISKDSIAFSGSGIFTNKNNEIRLVGLGKLKLRGEIDLNSLDRKQIKSITISKDKCNHYYASICYDVDVEYEEIDFKLKDKNKSVGLDLGLTHFLIDSQGKKIDNPRFLKRELEKLKFLDRCLSRKKKGSNSYKKCKLKRAKLFKSIINKRNYFFHCISKQLIENFDFIYVEDLSVKNMIKNRKLSRAISDVSWSRFISILSYKCDWYGVSLHKINKWFASSKTCSECGYQIDKLDLSIREWTCHECETIHDRDINAAQNILKRGEFELNNIQTPNKKLSKGICLT